MRVIDDRMNAVALPPDGLLLTDKLAEVLDIHPGQKLWVEIMEQERPVLEVPVVGTIKEFTTDSTDPEDWTFPARYKIKRELLRSMAPNGLFAHCAMLQAVEDARLSTVYDGDGRQRNAGLIKADVDVLPFSRLVAHPQRGQYGVGAVERRRRAFARHVADRHH